MAPVLGYNHVSKWFGSTKALPDVNFQVAPRGITGLLGPNGSGEPILIKFVNGLLAPDEGNLSVAGLPVGPESKVIVSYLPDKNYLNNWMKVLQLIDRSNDFCSDFDKNKVYEMLEGLDTKSDTKSKTISRGIEEKVQLVLVVNHKTSLHPLDESIGKVDSAARDYTLNTILANCNEESSIAISTHLIHDIEQVPDDVIFLKDGKVEMILSVDETRT